MIILNVKRSIKKDIFFTLIIITQLIITGFFVNSIIFSLGDLNKSINKFNINFNDNTKYFKLSDNMYDFNEEKKFFEDEKSFYNIKKFYEEIKESKDYRFLVNIHQPIEIVDFKGDNKFCYSYQRSDIKNDKFEIDNKKYTRVKNLSVNDKVINEFSFKASEGRLFKDKDYILNSKKDIIPVIIGSNLAEFYNIGDKFTAWLYFDDLEFEVVGILEKNTYTLDNDGEILYLDDYSVTPSLELNFETDNKKDYEAQISTYLSKVSGIIATEKNTAISDLIQKIDNLRSKYDIFDFSIIGVHKNTIDLLKNNANKNLEINIIISFVMLTFTIISSVCILSCKVKRNMRDYGIYLLNGATKNNIYLYIISELILLFSTSMGIAYLLNSIIFMGIIPYNIISLFICAMPIIVSLFVSITIISKYSINEMIRGEIE